MTESLDQLRAKLKDVQQTGGSDIRLNERNCVELIQILVQRQMIDLVYTRDGREYLTTEYLLREMQNEIDATGRLNILDLPGILNVDIVNIECQQKELLKQRPDISLICGEFITSSYLDSVAIEINEILSESPVLQLADIARRFNLDLPLIQEIVSTRLGTYIFGTLEETTLYTSAYIRRHEAVVIGAFTACSCPTSLSNILALLHTQSGDIPINESLFLKIVQKFVDSNLLNGKVTGGVRGIFTPSAYDAQRAELIHNTYASQKYIDYSFVANCCIPNPQQYLTQKYGEKDKTQPDKGKRDGKGKKGKDSKAKEVEKEKDFMDDVVVVPSQFAGVPFGSCFVSNSFFDEVSPHIDTVISATSAQDTNVVLNGRSFLSEHFSDEDCNGILSHVLTLCPHSERVALFGAVVINTAVLEEALLKEVATVVEEQPGAALKLEEEEVKKGGKGKRRGPSEGSSTSLPIGMQCFKECVIRSLPSNNELNSDEQEVVVIGLADLFKAKIEFIYNEVVRKRTESSTQAKKRVRQQNQQTINDLWRDVQLYSKGIASFKNVCDEEVFVQLNKKVLQTLCTELYNIVLQDSALELNVDLAAKKDMKLILQPFGAKVSKALLALFGTLSGSCINAFCDELVLKAGPEVFLSLRPFDKKKERQHQAEKREELQLRCTNILAKEGGVTLKDCEEMLSNIFSTVFSQRYTGVILPLVDIPMLDEYLKILKVMEEEKDTNQQLFELLSRAVSSLKGEPDATVVKGNIEDLLAFLANKANNANTLVKSPSEA